MIKKKIFSVLTAVSILGSLCISAISVSAAPTETTPFKIEYVDADTATKTVNVYYGDVYAEVGYLGYDFKITFPENTVTAVTVSNTDVAYILTDSYLANGYCKMTAGLMDAAIPENQLLFTLNFTLADNVDTFNMSVDSESLFTSGEEDEVYQDQSAVIQIPGNKEPEPSVVEIPAEDKGSFTTYADPSVKAFAATISGIDLTKTIKWVLSNSEGKTYSKAAVISTEVTGGSDVTLGLKVVGDISNIASAKLVIE